ncbi:MAG TPA: ADOP family duplicated permease [Candidatus Acidoferrales bacterium]|nr:ADOP family duplicated permease [Candidatus Acidoferrales bacterium]
MGAISQDAKYAIRRLRATPGYAAVAVASLALGIGANSALFSLLNALVLRDLPVWQPDHLVEIKALEVRTGQAQPLSLPMYLGLARDQKVFSAFCGEQDNGVFEIEANRWRGLGNVWLVSGEFYSVLGVHVPAAGSLLGPGDVNLPEGPARQVAVLGYGFWQRRFGGDPGAMGKIVQVAGVPFTVVGIAPKGFQGTSMDLAPELMIPLTAAPLVMSDAFSELDSRHLLWITGVGRLKPGVTLAEARAQLETVWPAIRQAALPPDENEGGRKNFLARRLLARSDARGDDNPLRARFTRPLEVLMGIAGLILALACANLAGLMLARAAARDREMSVRMALGASRTRLAREMIFEGILVAGGGACAGVALAWASSRALVAAITVNFQVAPAIDVRPDVRVLAFTVALAVLTGVLFSLAPAWRATRQDAMGAVRTGPRSTEGTGKLGKTVVVTQLALAVVLLACAGLLVRSFVELISVKTGYSSRDVLVARLAPLPGDKAALSNAAYWADVVRQVEALPGVVSATTGAVPGTGPGGAWKPAVAPAESQAGAGVLATYANISPGFFRTLGMDMVAGRDFSWSETTETSRVAIVSRSLANQLFPAGDAIGHLIRIGPDPRLQRVEIAGIASDARLFDARDPNLLAVYVSMIQDKSFDRWSAVEARVAGPPEALAGPVRRVIDGAGHEYALSFQTLDQVRARTQIDERITALLSGFFGGLGLLLAAIGLFGLVSYNVTRRTREIGLRLALGAEAASLRRMLLGETAALAGAGLAIGLPCALGARRLLAGMLFGMGAGDTTTLAVAGAIFFSVALAAGYLPARRAMRVDPTVALRHE